MIYICIIYFHFVLCKQANKWRAGCQAKADIYLYILCSLSLDVLFWPLVQFGSLFTWGQDNLNSSPCTPTWLPVWLLIIRDTQTAYDYVHNKDRKPPTPKSQTKTHKSRWKNVLLCIDKRQWGTDSTLVTSDTLNRLPAVDGLGSFPSLSNTDIHTLVDTHPGSAKHLLFLTPAGCECERGGGWEGRTHETEQLPTDPRVRLAWWWGCKLCREMVVFNRN